MTLLNMNKHMNLELRRLVQAICDNTEVLTEDEAHSKHLRTSHKHVIG